VRAAGSHRWRVDGRRADGKRVMSATLAFRALRAT
jgi:hypothetical protein